jgi:4-hydroxyphenylpyruvate dioxygenase
MFTSIATVSLSGDLDEKLAAIAAAGFAGVEIFENDFLSFDGAPGDVGRMIADLGLKCVAFQPFRDFEGMPEPQRSQAFTRAERKFDVMADLGADLLLVCSNVSPAALGGIDRAADDLRELGERAQKRGLKIGFEALAWGRHISDHRDAWEVVRRADHPAVGLILDSFHTLSRQLPVDSIRSIPGDRIFLVQVADAPKVEMDLLSWSRHLRSMPGQGDLPLGDFMAALGATGYDGALSLEIFNDQFRAGSARHLATDGQRSLINLVDQTARRDGSAPMIGERLPPRPQCLGVEFVEFAVDETIADELAALFAGLGFARAGRHVSKSVTLWRQGDINLVINTEKEGFAHSAYIVHGPSVCAIGLRVDDAANAMNRAERLLAQSFRQPVGPGELEIPAIRGIGGSLIYFIEPKGELGRVWEIEFTPEGGDGGDAILERIDHIAQSMTHQEMLSWVLAYTSILDLEKTPQLDIADPGGLVHSQVVQSPGGAVRMALNSSESPKTMSSRFLTELFGSGVQHIAFETGNIFTAVAAMEANGMTMLPIPANYYDDLAGRFDIGDDMLADLKAHDVLYDRDEAGEYFQIYTRTFADRFFFEVVERRDYQGFGAVNAPIRLAAQTRGAVQAGIAGYGEES